MATSILELSEHVNIVTTVVIERDGKFLMVQESKPDIYGRWNFPSGKVEVGETLFEAAKRETLEETGITVRLTGIFEIAYEQWQSGNGVGIRFVFRGETSEDLGAEIAKDVLAVEWKSDIELRDLLTSDKLRNTYVERLVEKALKKDGTVPLELLHFFTNDFMRQNLTSR